MVTVETLFQLRAQQPQRRVGQWCVNGRTRRVDGRQCVDQGSGLVRQFLAVFAVVLRHPAQQRGEIRHAMARRWWKVGCPEKWSLVVGQEHGQWPATTAPREQLVSQLVDAIQVRAFLAIDLDVDEQLVHHRSGSRILEGFMRHHMTPVAGRVADGQQHRLAGAARFGESSFSPWMPVHRIGCMLQQVGAGFGRKAIAACLQGGARIGH